MTTKANPKNRSRKFTYHPFEATLCGYSGSGKTTLVTKLLAHWGGKYKVGFVKHDAHRFEMDKPGKDTYEAAEAGAAGVLINDPRHFAKISSTPYSVFERGYAFVDADFVIAEGFKQSKLPKLLLLDAEGRAAREFADGAFENVIALVGPGEPAERPADLPFFHRDDVATIAGFLEHRFLELARAPLYGLVLVGGESRRMGKPKWALSYHEEPQALRTAKLLATVCEQVFLSVRPGQDVSGLEAFPQIADRFPSWGPMAGMLSAMHEHPAAAWLVAATDLPFLDEPTLKALVDGAHPFKIATAYTSANDGLPEPLCAIYQPRAAQRLLQAAGLGMTCPRKTLIESSPRLLTLVSPRALDNANTPEEFEAARTALRSQTI